MVDKENTGMWFEVTADTKQDCEKRAVALLSKKAVILSCMTFKKSQWHSPSRCSAGNLLLANRKTLKVTPIAAAHPDAIELSKCFPTPRGKISQLLLSYGNERVDVRGVVASVVDPSSKANKMEVWLEDESGKALLVEMWGDTFVALAKTLSRGLYCR